MAGPWDADPIAPGSTAPANAAPWQSDPVVGENQPLAWSDVGSQAVRNIPSSAVQFGRDIAQPFLHPIDTAKNLAAVGHGALQKAGVMSGEEDIPAANAIGGYFANRYGGVENFKRALAKDPVGVAGDLSALLTGGETTLARAPGLVGRGWRDRRHRWPRDRSGQQCDTCCRTSCQPRRQCRGRHHRDHDRRRFAGDQDSRRGRLPGR